MNSALELTPAYRVDSIKTTISRAPSEAARPTLNQELPELARVIAIVGCDGSGKTRLAADLVKLMRCRGPAERRYMGLISGETGDKIRHLPLIGVALERHLAAKTRRAQDMDKKLPGTITAIVMYLLSAWRVTKVRHVIRLSRGGVSVIAERYPQADIAGFHYDGPGLDDKRSDNWLVRRLSARERTLYQWMAEQRPALVLRLMVDPDTAFARKSDHPMSELVDKIEKMPQITYNGARIREIDARLPYQEVLAAALREIDLALVAS